jgi:hypothetical protein
MVYGDSGCKGVNYVQKGPFEYRNCYLNLDMPKLPPTVMLEGGVGISCINCIVEYSGGPIPVKVQLVDCAFIFHLQSKPSEPGLRFAKVVLETPKLVVAS